MIELRGWLKDWRVEVVNMREHGPPPRLAGTGETVFYTVRIDVPTIDTWEDRAIVVTHTFAYPYPGEPTVAFIHECVRRVAVHEVDEGFWVKGSPPFNPHNHPDGHNTLPPWARWAGAIDIWTKQALEVRLGEGRIGHAPQRR